MVVGITIAVMTVIGLIGFTGAMWMYGQAVVSDQVTPPDPPPQIDRTRCVEVPPNVREEIASAFRVGHVDAVTLPVGSGEAETWVRLDRADALSWSAVPGDGGIWIAVDLWIVEVERTQSRTQGPWDYVTDAAGLALYWKPGSFSDSRAPQQYRENPYLRMNPTKLQTASEIAWDPEATATAAACLEGWSNDWQIPWSQFEAELE